MIRANFPYLLNSSVAGAANRVERRAAFTILIATALISVSVAASTSDLRLGVIEGQAYSEATRLFREKRWEDGAIVLRGILRRNPDALNQSPAVVMDLVKALAFSGRREEAVSFLGQALSREKKAESRGAWAERIQMVSRLFLTNAAFQLYQDGVNLLDAGRTNQAREKFEKALEREPDNIEILVRMGQCLVIAGDDDSAAERLRLAHKVNPYEPEISLWLGRALHHRGELNLALEELRFAADHLPTSELAPLWYAEALAAAGKRDQALQWLSDSIGKNPMNLSLLIASAKTKAEEANSAREGTRDMVLWSARRDLQLALSRLSPIPEASPKPDDSSENPEEPVVHNIQTSDLAFEPRKSPTELKAEIVGLQQKVDKALSADRST